MNLFDITMHSLRRQKGKKLFLLIAMLLSLSTMLILFSFVQSQELQLERQFDQYGANIIITPKTDDLSLTYGGVSLTGIVTNLKEIKKSEVAGIYLIENKENIRAVSPKLIGVGMITTPTMEKDALLVGVDFEEEGKIKAWWNVDGAYPDGPKQALLGATAAEKLNLSIGDDFFLQGDSLRVAGILNTTGSQDDSSIMLDIGYVGEVLGKPGKISLIEVSALCSDCTTGNLK